MDSTICEAPIKAKRSQSGGTVCCVPGCNNNTKSGRRISWHVFPKDRRIRDEWLGRVKRRGQFVDGVYFRWEPKYHHRVCGFHFDISGIKQKSQEVPSLFPACPTSPITTGRRRNKRAKLADLTPPDDDMEARFLLTSSSAVAVQTQSNLNAIGSPAYRYNGCDSNKVHSVDQLQNINHQLFFNTQDNIYVADSFPPKNGSEDLRATLFKQISIIEKLESDNRLLRQQLQDTILKANQLQLEAEDLKKVVFDKAVGVFDKVSGVKLWGQASHKKNVGFHKLMGR